MATALIDQYGVVLSEVGQTAGDAFQRRCLMSALNAAQAIATEAVNTPNHTNRVAFSKAVSQSPTLWSTAFALMLAAQGLDGTSTDVQINTMIASVWNTMAGAL